MYHTVLYMCVHIINRIRGYTKQKLMTDISPVCNKINIIDSVAIIFILFMHPQSATIDAYNTLSAWKLVCWFPFGFIMEASILSNVVTEWSPSLRQLHHRIHSVIIRFDDIINFIYWIFAYKPCWDFDLLWRLLKRSRWATLPYLNFFLNICKYFHINSLRPRFYLHWTQTARQSQRSNPDKYG